MTIHGWINIDKPEDMTSNQVLGCIKKKFGKMKIGHAGTLDPFATGILPVAIGEATKTTNYMMDKTKIYQFTLQFGAITDTLDKDGVITATTKVRPSLEQLKDILPQFIGTISQVPPNYSAIKVNGQKSYDRARDGVEFTLPSRQVLIKSLAILEFDDYSGACLMEAIVGKGTYIRSLARDIAAILGSLGYVTTLRRTRVGKFDLTNSIKLADLLEKQDLKEVLLPVDQALDDILALILSELEADKIRFGQTLDVDHNDGLYRAYSNDKLLALCNITDKKLTTQRVFNL